MTAASVVRAPRAGVASVWPVVAGAMAVVLSLILAIWTETTATLAPLGPIALPVAAIPTYPLSIAGYVLTPFLTIAALAWDRAAQSSGLRNDRNFALRPRYGLMLRFLTLAGFVIALVHIVNLADAVAAIR